MTTTRHVIVHPDEEDGGYWVKQSFYILTRKTAGIASKCRSLPGCISQGDEDCVW